MTGPGIVTGYDLESFQRRPNPEPDWDILNDIQESLKSLHRKVDQAMTDITGLSADVATLTSSVAAGKTALDDLAAKVASLSAGTVTQAEIDALDASVKAASAALDSAVATDDPAPAPAPTPVVGP